VPHHQAGWSGLPPEVPQRQLPLTYLQYVKKIRADEIAARKSYNRKS
jgi:hypothetical protein